MKQQAKPKLDDKEQAKAFRRAARELGCDDNEERFTEVLRTIAKAKPRPRPQAKKRIG
jgi:hypothetical protein